MALRTSSGSFQNHTSIGVLALNRCLTLGFLQPGETSLRHAVCYTGASCDARGVTATSSMTHIAIVELREGKTVEWMENVDDKEYHAVSPAAKNARVSFRSNALISRGRRMLNVYRHEAEPVQLAAEGLPHLLDRHRPAPMRRRNTTASLLSSVVSQPLSKRTDHLLSGAVRSCTPYNQGTDS